MDDQDRRNSRTLTAFVHTCRGNGGQPHPQLEKGFSELPRERDLATPAMASTRVIPNFTISAQRTSSDACSADHDHRNTGTLTAFVHTCRGNRGQPHPQMEKGFSELPRERDEATPGEMGQHQQCKYESYTKLHDECTKHIFRHMLCLIKINRGDIS